jgi:hypothetical protein
LFIVRLIFVLFFGIEKATSGIDVLTARSTNGTTDAMPGEVIAESNHTGRDGFVESDRIGEWET